MSSTSPTQPRGRRRGREDEKFVVSSSSRTNQPVRKRPRRAEPHLSGSSSSKKESESECVWWVKELESWLISSDNCDQDAEAKNRFVRTAKAGDVTRLHALGISNPSVKSRVVKFHAQYKDDLRSCELIQGLDFFVRQRNWVEGNVLVCYVLERFLQNILFDAEDSWRFIVDNWLEHVDHWITADHLCGNVLGYFDVCKEQFLSEIVSWSKSENFWMRRLSMVIFIKALRLSEEAADRVLEIIEGLIADKNYYVRKAIPWVLREATRFRQDACVQLIRNRISSLSKTEVREATTRCPETVVKEVIELYDQRRKSSTFK